MIETSRPKHIVLFESLMYGALAIGLIDRIVLVVAHEAEAVYLAIGLLTVFPVVCWFIWLVARRRKTWPIWLFVLATIVETRHDVIRTSHLLQMRTAVSGFVGITSLGQFAMQLTALGLIFSKNSSQWFDGGHGHEPPNLAS